MNVPEFDVVIIGTDIFGYYWARSFYEAYGVKPYLLGMVDMKLTSTSTLIEDIVLVEGDLKDPDYFVSQLLALANRIHQTRPGRDLILVPTSDHYVRLTAENRDRLEGTYSFHVPDLKFVDLFMLKENFYPFAEDYGLAIPQTKIQSIDERMPHSYSYPVIIKPSDGVTYYKHAFEGQEKLYRADNYDEAEKIRQAIYRSGYPGTLIIQEYIPGGDSLNYDANSYTGPDGKVQWVSFSQIVLDEPEHTATGNHAALITRYEPEIMTKLKVLLEDIHYTGFANFDLKKDPRDGELKIFEVNVRAGRSAYYVDQMGGSLARTLTEGIYGLSQAGDTHYFNNTFLSSFAPKGVLNRWVSDRSLKQEVNDLIKQGKAGNPLKKPGDLPLKRRVYLFLRDINYYRKFARNYTEEGMA